MKCPKCYSNLEKVVVDNIEIDKCVSCKGIWFDMLEKEDLLKIIGSEKSVDETKKIDKDMNKINDIKCPKCKTNMIPMVDMKSGVEYESCTKCYGIYLDDGEFSKMKNTSMFDKIKNILDK